MEVSLFYNMANHLRSQALSQMTIRAKHVRPHVHLKKQPKSLPLWWKATQLWLFYSFVIVVLCEFHVWLQEKNDEFSASNMSSLSCIKITVFFQAPPLPNVLRQVRLMESSLIPSHKNFWLSSSKLMLCWCCCCCSIFCIYLHISSRISPKVRWSLNLWFDARYSRENNTTTTGWCFFESKFTELESVYASQFYSCFFHSNVKAESFINWFTFASDPGSQP